MRDVSELWQRHGKQQGERRSITGQSVVDNMVIVTSGLVAGDIVTTAGVSFLSDGQRVKLYEPKAASAALE